MILSENSGRFVKEHFHLIIGKPNLIRVNLHKFVQFVVKIVDRKVPLFIFCVLNLKSGNHKNSHIFRLGKNKFIRLCPLFLLFPKERILEEKVAIVSFYQFV